MYDIVILGAGASGLQVASNLLYKNICIIDKNTKIAQKIKVSGGAKCNITNRYLDEHFYLGDPSFIKQTLSNYTNDDLLEFLNHHNIYPKINEKIVKGTYFCNSSQDVIDMFTKLTAHCTFRLNTQVLSVSYEECFLIKTTQGTIKAKKLIVASGGLSYKELGATSIGFDIAKQFGHNIIQPNPALVGLTVQKDQFWFKQLSGLSVEVKITVAKKVLEGKLLFTHKGCSGPVILSTSLYWQKGKFSIDFLPYKNSYLPKRVRSKLKALDIDIHNYQISPAGNFGYTKAEVTKGGVDTSQLKPTFESKKQDGLYFIGEVVDVTGELGGYNFQWAFSSAIACVKDLV